MGVELWFNAGIMAKIKDRVGEKHGQMTCVKYMGKTLRGDALFLWKCDCGTIKTMIAHNLIRKNAKVRSCGCLRLDGGEPLYGTKFYYTFHLMKQRCNNPNLPRYKAWGGRGIKCLWKSFKEFKLDMYQSFQEHDAKNGGRYTTLDRINNDSHYCKENCRWATPKEQSSNTRRNVDK